jgi:hypothetical protein
MVENPGEEGLLITPTLTRTLENNIKMTLKAVKGKRR